MELETRGSLGVGVSQCLNPKPQRIRRIKKEQWPKQGCASRPSHAWPWGSGRGGFSLAALTMFCPTAEGEIGAKCIIGWNCFLRSLGSQEV